MSNTISQQVLLDLLGDGRPHTKAAIKEHLGSPDMADASLRALICRTRRALARRNQTILCEYVKRKTHYRWVSLLRGSE